MTESTIVRLIQHAESYQVRVSRFFYFDDNPGRASISGRPAPGVALRLAQRRTQFILRHGGIQTLHEMLANAYFQGMIDCMDIFVAREAVAAHPKGN